MDEVKSRGLTPKEKEDYEKFTKVVETFDFEKCSRFIKECEAEDVAIDDMRVVVADLVDILIETGEYPNGYADFLREVELNDFTLTHNKKKWRSSNEFMTVSGQEDIEMG